MAKTTASRHCEILVIDLLHDLELKVDEYTRCNEILSRLQRYKPEDKLPVEIVDFIGNYAGIEIVDAKEGLLTTAGAIMSKAVDSLMKAIIWIIDKLKEFFKYCFDNEYRACKDALDIQRKVITIGVNVNAKNKFENTVCSVIKKDDINNIILKTQNLIELIRNAASLSKLDFVDTLIKSHCEDSGVRFDVTSMTLTDVLPTPAPDAGTTFQAAGWTFESVNDVLINYVSMLKGIESLKDAKKEAESAAADLKKRAEQSALRDATAANINQLQSETATRVAATKIVGFAIVLCIRRSNNILAFLNSLYQEMVKASK